MLGARLKVAIIHYWLVGMRGGEKVLEAMCEMFPDADIFTHVYRPEAISQTITRHNVHTTFIDKLPWSGRLYKKYLPLMPLALEQLDLRAYELVISSESGPAKGVISAPESVHVCYCHSPMRYVWNMYHDYRAQTGWLGRMLMAPVAHYLRVWDTTSAARVDHFVANSHNVARRIRKYYRRDADVIHPPVDTAAFTPHDDHGDFYLCVGELVAYKKIDLAIEAFRASGRKLVVIGGGERLSAMRERAGGNIEVMGWQPFDVVRDHLARCRALVFPGEEDFGIVPVEAMASGKPVIAYRKGGAVETVIDGETGVFFDAQTVNALNDAVETFEGRERAFSAERIAKHASRFDVSVFKARFEEFVAQRLADR
jgi:glycosyltransferase involved in cell wall biosynthesis